MTTVKRRWERWLAPRRLIPASVFAALVLLAASHLIRVYHDRILVAKLTETYTKCYYTHFLGLGEPLGTGLDEVRLWCFQNGLDRYLLRVECCELINPGVNDDTIDELLQLRGLRSVMLVSANISDEGILRLSELPNLRAVTIDAPNVSDEAFNELQRRRPGLVVNR